MPKRIKSDAPLATASIGDWFAYTHPQESGYGENARGEPLTAEMTELDLQHGSLVQILAYDEDSGWPLVGWIDGKGINRITTINPDNLTLFVPHEM